MIKILGLVPARGGSKGIKNKNIVDLAGKPLISYVIEALKRSNLVNKILCTTDSQIIADVANKYGAETPFLRPSEMAEDSSPIFPALTHAVKKLEELQGYKPDYIVVAQPTYPLMRPDQIDDAIKLAIEKKADSVVTVVVLDHDVHPFNIREILPNNRVKFWMTKEHYKYPSRQSKPKFYKFGNIFVSNYETLVNKGKIEGEMNYALEVDRLSTLDINIPEDLSIIECILKNSLKE